MEYITSIQGYGKFLSKLPDTKLIGFDLETTGLDPFIDTPTLAQFNLDGEIFLFNLVKLGKEALAYIVDVINGQVKPKLIIGHNLKFDLQFIKTSVDRIFTNVYDTMLAEQLIYKGLDKNFYPSLKYVVYTYCMVDLSKEMQTSFIGDTSGEFTDEQLEYAAKDVEYLFEIYQKQLAKLTEQKQLKTLTLEREVIPVFSEMELNGVRINKEKWLSLLGPAQEQVKESLESIVEYFFNNVNTKYYSTTLDLMTALCIPVKTKRDQNKYGALGKETFKEIVLQHINFSSSKQTVALLKLCGVDTESSAEKALVNYKNYEVVLLLFNYRENAKKVSTYGEKYFENIHPVTGKIHTTLEQNESDTGRVASSKPCLTQIPTEVDKKTGIPTYRGCIIPDEGYVYIDKDYSGQELRLAADILNEPKLKEAFKNGVDVHKLSGSLMYKIPIEQVTKEQRQRGKTLNFGCLFGISAWGLNRNFGFDKKEAKEVLDNFWNGYAGMKKSVDNIAKMITTVWYSTTPNGRKRYFRQPDKFALGVEEYDKQVAAICREGINHCIQGCAADVTKTALKYIYYRNPYGRDLRIVLSVHDEILCMAKKEISVEAEQFVEACMLEAEQEFLTDVPAKVEGGIYDYWGH